ncbi:hypothetical protein SODALDRAFT_329935 [Sodiomyces alkalinus F11]|uniref:Uncharacterized protein n=1 Tax=Sodiomyces alkalinus (strain CBS 110278 / VKM F-3762 / F11) TaxID=1314773 RepID=A0A3N2Q0F5_SODAK|nr:hypothetical protein SODALDRAFT_329935 [Sodiomyces alkalinus F11]ROT40247.1 hypothetical protein SODALDRAFT_329935 [Sodiomyces alkalinus F11]
MSGDEGRHHESHPDFLGSANCLLTLVVGTDNRVVLRDGFGERSTVYCFATCFSLVGGLSSQDGAKNNSGKKIPEKQRDGTNPNQTPPPRKLPVWLSDCPTANQPFNDVQGN